MKNRSKSSNTRLRNDLDWLDPDQPLTMDESYPTDIPQPEMTLRESLSYGLRSTLAVIICLVIPVMWYFDWNPSALAERTSEAVTGVFTDSPPLPAPVEAPLPPTFLGDGITDYMAQLKEVGLMEEFSSPAMRAFYENSVPVAFLNDLHNSDLLKELSFPAIIAFYQNNIPIDYLSQIQNSDLLDELSFPAIVSFHQNNVPLDYLNRLKEVNLLEEFSLPAIVAFHQNAIPLDFLQQLQDRDLLGSLSFPDIVNMYQADS